MGCPPVRGDNQRALASGLSNVQVGKHGIIILYHLHQCRLAHHEIFCAKVGKGDIKTAGLNFKWIIIFRKKKKTFCEKNVFKTVRQK